MEIILLLVIIILLVFFSSTQNSKISALETKLSKLEDFLKRKDFTHQQKSAESNPDIITEQVQKPTEPIVVQSPPVASDEIKTPEINNEPVKHEPEISKPINVTNKPVINKVPKESWYESFRKNNPDLEKFIGENILSKVAITVLVIGIAFFVKYAIDKDWINEVARVGIGILCGAIVLGFAHRLHKKFKAFSSVLVGGGIAIFYFTIGIAFHQYQLFNQTTAFIIMLLITSFSVFISVMYNRVELAAISLMGGFATPFMVSTGAGNYVVLFTYVLILDLGMLVLAYLRKWNLINILAYAFTMLLFFGWLQTKVIGYENAPYKGAIIFASIFYVVFVLMNIINNIKQKQKFGSIELSILISNTFLFYGLGMQILSWWHPELKGLFSLLMALFNLVCSWLLYKKFKSDTKLVYLMIGLTLTFATLVAPVQLHGNYITIFWALEAVLLMWLSQKSGIIIYKFASVIISTLMLVSLSMDWINVYTSYYSTPLLIIANKAFITGLISAFSMLGLGLLLKKETTQSSYQFITFNPKIIQKFALGSFCLLLYFTGLFEVIYQFSHHIYNSNTSTIAGGAYHLIFVCVLNVAFNKASIKTLTGTVQIINLLSAALFVLFFASLPVSELKESLIDGYHIHIGFVLHYFSLISFCIIIYNIYCINFRGQTTIKINQILGSTLIAISVLYISSLELTLHVVKLALPNESYTLNYNLKYSIYNSINTHTAKIGYPILWGIIAFVFLFIGMKKSNKTLRISALVLIAITLIKLFMYDINDASEAGKIIAFIILGVVLLIISFMYQKIKALIIDGDSENKVE